MTRDDKHVIIYQILKYLSEIDKRGLKTDPVAISSAIFSINQEYWKRILLDMLSNGLIIGVQQLEVDSADIVLGNLQEMRITLKGEEYLIENSVMNKVKNSLKDIKSMVPFI